MKVCGIYLLTHIESGRKYVGQSADIHARWRMHARGYGQTWLARSIRQHGWSAFAAEVLERCKAGELNDAEARWIATLGTVMPNGFNLTSGGLYFKKSAETIAKSIAFHTGRKRSPETCERIGAAKRGSKHSAQTKSKMSAAHKRAHFQPGASRQAFRRKSEAGVERRSEGENIRGERRPRLYGCRARESRRGASRQEAFRRSCRTGARSARRQEEISRGSCQKCGG